MTRHTTLRLRVYATAGLVGLISSLGVGRPEPALIGVAFMVLAIAGLEAVAVPSVRVSLEGAPRSVVEGELMLVRLAMSSTPSIRNAVLDLTLSTGLSLVAVDGGRRLDRTRVLVDVAASSSLECLVAAEGWGQRTLGPPVLTLFPPLGMMELRQSFGKPVRLVVIPSDAPLAEALAPEETNLHAGDLVSSGRGSGLEFAEIRPYRDGDDPRWLNWRVTSRSGERWVNDRHPERNGDIVLIVDAQSQLGSQTGVVIDRAVRLSASLVRQYGRRHYRIGLITVGGIVSWVEPGSGEAHRRRVLEQLLTVDEGEANPDAIQRAVRRLVSRPALVVVLSPMIDGTVAGLAHSMRVGGIDVAMIEVDPSGLLPEPPDEATALGRRLWQMERQRLRDLLADDGIPVALWSEGETADVPLSRLSTWKRSWRRPA